MVWRLGDGMACLRVRVATCYNGVDCLHIELERPYQRGEAAAGAGDDVQDKA